MSDENPPVPNDLDPFPDFPEFAYSLFDDFKSKEAEEVYDHMEKKFGFKYNLLGKSMLHRVALLNYLEDKKEKKEDVLAAYKKLEEDKAPVMDHFEKYISPPFRNEKLIWGFMEDEDDEADEALFADLLPNFKMPGPDGDFAFPDFAKGDGATGGPDPFDMENFDPREFKLPEFPKFDDLENFKMPDFPELEKLRERMEKLRASNFRDVFDLPEPGDLTDPSKSPEMPPFPEPPAFPAAEPGKGSSEL